MWRPVAPPPSRDFLCQGNFVGVFGKDRDAFLNMSSRGNGDVDGFLSLVDPDANYTVDGYCEQKGDYADVEISLNGGQPYEGQIYVADDGEIYFEGEQDGTNISFVLHRE